jgi:hypothetical protein
MPDHDRQVDIRKVAKILRDGNYSTTSPPISSRRLAARLDFLHRIDLDKDLPNDSPPRSRRHF